MGLGGLMRTQAGRGKWRLKEDGSLVLGTDRAKHHICSFAQHAKGALPTAAQMSNFLNAVLPKCQAACEA